MAHTNDTQSQPIPMPRHSGLIFRKGRAYLNIRIPKDIRHLYPKCKNGIIREALGTSNWREAKSAVLYKSSRLIDEFENKRKTLTLKQSNESPSQLFQISDREAHEIVHRFFIDLEKTSEDWWRTTGYEMSNAALKDVLNDLRMDSSVFNGGDANGQKADGSLDLKLFLEAEGLTVPEGSPAYLKLRSLFRLARLENIERTIDRVSRKPVEVRETIFRDLFSNSETKSRRQVVTLRQMLDRYKKVLVDTKRSAGTLRTYEIPARILCEVLGENRSLDSINREDMRELFTLLRKVPANAKTKRKYKYLNIRQAIDAADKCGESHRLGSKTLANYFNNIAAAFNFAIDEQLIKENPASGRWLRASFTEDEEETPKALFDVEEMNQLFRAPLYTGCRDDERNYAKPGPNKPRRGRFWVPLIALFHGFRCNEAAQLYVEDVKLQKGTESESGVYYFAIREERDDGSKCDKRLKTKQSKRCVPIHPELLKMGFLEFVAERKNDTSHPRLFPDLPCGASGYFSDPFGKWFGRFVVQTLGEKCEATIHSFRHQFRDALTEAEVPIPLVERIGGWELMKRSSERDYGKGPSMNLLFKKMGEARYPGLNLEHLYLSELKPVANL